MQKHARDDLTPPSARLGVAQLLHWAPLWIGALGPCAVWGLALLLTPPFAPQRAAVSLPRLSNPVVPAPLTNPPSQQPAVAPPNPTPASAESTEPQPPGVTVEPPLNAEDQATPIDSPELATTNVAPVASGPQPDRPLTPAASTAEAAFNAPPDSLSEPSPTFEAPP
jgi:hypothetical protein